jgi:hypothetical protein
MQNNEYNLADIIICYTILPKRAKETNKWVMNMIQKLKECEL